MKIFVTGENLESYSEKGEWEEEIGYQTTSGNKVISIQKDSNKYTIIIDERYCDTMEPHVNLFLKE